MTKNELVRALCQHEALKSQVAVGNVRELLRILREMVAQDSSVLTALLTPPKRKAKR